MVSGAPTGARSRASAVVLATGHSARDVYGVAARAGLELEAKAFALGVRVEHPQPLIDQAQYGADAAPLPVAGGGLSPGDHGRGARRLLVLHVPGRLDRAGDDRSRMRWW